MKKPSLKGTFLTKICVSKMICDHLVGEEHSSIHRYSVGVVIMGIGVGLTKAVFLIDLGIIHYLGDVIGYGIHGIGAIPFVDGLIKKHQENG